MTRGRRGNRGRTAAAFAAAALLGALAAAVPTGASTPLPEPGAATPLAAQVQHLHFKYGPLQIAPGGNLILIGPVTIEKPAYDGYMLSFKPNLVDSNGVAPPTEEVHLHHGVFVNMSRHDVTDPSLPERFAATGEEKTITRAPPGYGYLVRGSDTWAVNYMLHNQTPIPRTVWITYDMDYLPATAPAAKSIHPVTPVWMDVENGKAYPVFDVHRGSGAGGVWTYPEQARPWPYGQGGPHNEWTFPRNATLIGTAGHVHPGGLYTDLDVIRPGARVASPRTRLSCGAARRTRRHRSHRTRTRARAARSRCRRVAVPAPIAGHEPSSVRVFRSNAHYWDPGGPISWDMAMTASRPDWKVAVHKGDKLAISATYETRRASWYESMGIMVVFVAWDDRSGADPFARPVDTTGEVTHGRLPENTNHGGATQPGAVDPTRQPDGGTLANGIAIQDFTYTPGNLGQPGELGQPPVVRQGDQLRFGNFDAAAQIYHTITACRAPCNASTGLSYPLADGPVDFDSGELGSGPQGFTAAANREDWYTPKSLPAGTYTYFCRIHPFMRGAFRVLPAGK